MTALLNLPLLCMPQDVINRVGISGMQLREDDANLASGQTISATAAASVGAVTISIAALQYPLLNGTVLTWNQAGVEEPVSATLTAAASAGATSLTVAALTTAIPSGAQAIDNGVNVWQASLALTGCKYATDHVAMYCNRYDIANLRTSWMVNQWATTFAVHWLGTRRMMPAPTGIQAEYDLALEELKQVRSGQLLLPNVAPRTSGWPFMSNVTIDLNFPVRRVRVEASISEPTPTQYAQSIDYNSILSVGW